MNPSTTLQSPTMDISALVHHDGDAAVLPRRSLSHPHSLSAASPVSSSAHLPTPPKPVRRQMPLKRKRLDPKPVWAFREGEELPPELKRLQEQRQQARPPPPPTPQPQHTPTPRPQAQPPQSMPLRNGAPSNGNGAPPRVITLRELSGFERPVSNDALVYDEVSRKVCDFIYVNAITNDLVRHAIAESEHTNLEIEARWGQLSERTTNSRLRGYHDTETIVKTQAMDISFASAMTMEEHKRMNMYLNKQVQESNAPGSARPPIRYQHTKEVDTLYNLGQEQFATLPDMAKRLISASGVRQRIRVTRDQKTGEVIRSMIKVKMLNLEISSPQTTWDYRIGINIEINYTGPVENLTMAVEGSKADNDLKRHKDRMSYSWLGAYQVDLTQVLQGPTKVHELELELTSDVLLDHGDRIRHKEPTEFESLIAGMMNNLRVLSREITPQ